MVNKNYWFQKPDVIFNLENYNKLLPSKTDEYPEKINAVVRLSIVVGVLAALINLNPAFFFIPLITMLITYLVYLGRKKRLEQMEKFAREKKKRELELQNIAAAEALTINDEGITELRRKIKGEQCTPPTKDNIFMNAMPYDDRQRYEACDQTEDKQIRAKMNSMFAILPHDSNDIFNRNDGRYGFHTMPATTFPNDRDTFAKWAYRTGMSCKEGNGVQCYNNLHSELNSQLTGGGNACTGCNA